MSQEKERGIESLKNMRSLHLAFLIVAEKYEKCVFLNQKQINVARWTGAQLRLDCACHRDMRPNLSINGLRPRMAGRAPLRPLIMET